MTVCWADNVSSRAEILDFWSPIVFSKSRFAAKLVFRRLTYFFFKSSQHFSLLLKSLPYFSASTNFGFPEPQAAILNLGLAPIFSLFINPIVEKSPVRKNEGDSPAFRGEQKDVEEPGDDTEEAARISSGEIFSSKCSMAMEEMSRSSCKISNALSPLISFGLPE